MRIRANSGMVLLDGCYFKVLPGTTGGHRVVMVGSHNESVVYSGDKSACEKALAAIFDTHGNVDMKEIDHE